MNRRKKSITHAVKARVVKELDREYGLKSHQDEEKSLRFVWRQNEQKEDWIALAAQEDNVLLSE